MSDQEANDWAARVDWANASRDLQWISEYESDGDEPSVVMSYRPATGDGLRLGHAWGELPRHPHLLEAVRSEHYGPLLRYAAIDWRRTRRLAAGDAVSASELASWMVQLADAYRMVLGASERMRRLVFGDPRVYIDVGGCARLGFGAPTAMLFRVEERDLVQQLAARLRALCPTVPVEMTDVIDRCTDPKPKNRYRSLAVVAKACHRAVHMEDPLRRMDRLVAWEHVEAGFGLLAVRRYPLALARFERALEYDDYADLARWGVDFARARWTERPVGRGRHFAMSPAAFGPAVAPEVTDLLGEARRALENRDATYAMAVAQELVRREPDNLDGMTVLVSAYFDLGHNTEAIAYIDALVARAPGEGTYHYLRGKVLFRLGRLPEARDSFERALVLNPLLAEALHLRREVDRATGTASKTVGSQHAPVIDIPESLEPLREVLARGQTREIVEVLSRSEHDGNPDAQLLLARFLRLEGEAGRASAIYHRFADAAAPYRQRALVGKAGLLLDLGLSESALAVFDVVCAEAQTDLDASEGRAQALERLGRLGEAAAEYRRFVGLANARADLRVRAAQQWLDAHAL